MQIILLEKVRNLGELGDEVKVRSGYGRNFLIPHHKAVIANKDNRASFEARRADLEQANRDALAGARVRHESLNGATVQIVTRASEEGKLFGSVGTVDIAEALVKAGFTVTRSEILLPQGSLKYVGDHEVHLALHAEVATHIIVSVVAEKG